VISRHLSIGHEIDLLLIPYPAADAVRSKILFEVAPFQFQSVHTCSIVCNISEQAMEGKIRL
jgi:hypothetical protein